ncbi:hypothetical protein TVAG_076040 [Trichomonas vaginalis G3]|uniref:Uncharacterized protein n=1 Tax=Trichomonas vaginalis (strain ATCC PRA-98 / G3) TaxID=412133 RepID=A2D9K1_TRIV3|nr:hypothetical protein TVAGG3_0293110 [Trichomonas vaginalis G3]EAY22857.1 hypothetical protein TVAG_076040 [Trichomonas vaginalis G3]KAI5527429.1 hypothetical protein TVAGG3_0293110 [Trichomonas vaginalis G3]|eukprot:XP_001583843.1 hypothetical protein [Trichomonas vaginalis G3]
MLISKYWEKMKSIFANLLYCKYKKRASSNKPTRTSYKISGYSENLYFSFIFLNIKDLKTNYIYPCYYLIVREGQQQIFDARPHEVTRYLPEHDVYLRFLTKEIESLKVKQRDLERRACEIVMPPIRTQRSDGVDKDGGLNKDPDNTDKEDEMKNKSDEKEKSTIPEYLVKAFEKLIEKCDREGTYFSTLYS